MYGNKMKEISDRKQKMIDEFLATPLKVGEHISVKYDAVNKWSKDPKSRLQT